MFQYGPQTIVVRGASLGEVTVEDMSRRVSKDLLSNWDDSVDWRGFKRLWAGEWPHQTHSVYCHWVTLTSTSPALTTLSRFRRVFLNAATTLYMVVLLALATGLVRALRPLTDLMVCDSSKSCMSEKLTVPLGRLKINKKQRSHIPETEHKEQRL